MKCRTQNCRGTVNKHTCKSPFCSKCRNRRWKLNSPLAYYFHKLRSRARERGITLSLTLEEYTEFAENTDYASLKGKSGLSLTIDRIDNGLGYHWWNIAAITKSENSRKMWVPFFNGGVLPKDDRQKYLQFERDYRDRCESLAANLIKRFNPGSPKFWKEFTRQKDKMFSKEVQTA